MKRTALRLDNLLKILLFFIPLAAAAAYLHWGALTVFVFACIAIIPLAGMMGEATERIASRLGAGIGGG